MTAKEKLGKVYDYVNWKSISPLTGINNVVLNRKLRGAVHGNKPVFLSDEETAKVKETLKVVATEIRKAANRL